jgi:hypothetical protein
MRIGHWTFGLAVVALSCAVLSGARAHDKDHPELNGWFENLQSGEGRCCDGSDANHIDDADWESKNGRYRVRVGGEWVDVPDQALVHGPNRADRTMLWLHYIDGHPIPRCFMPGSMS